MIRKSKNETCRSSASMRSRVLNKEETTWTRKLEAVEKREQSLAEKKKKLVEADRK